LFATGTSADSPFGFHMASGGGVNFAGTSGFAAANSILGLPIYVQQSFAETTPTTDPTRIGPIPGPEPLLP